MHMVGLLITLRGSGWAEEGADTGEMPPKVSPSQGHESKI